MKAKDAGGEGKVHPDAARQTDSEQRPDSAKKPDAAGKADASLKPDAMILWDQAAPDAPVSCAAMDVQGVGACEMILGYFWDGKTCKSLSGCSCAGKDCAKLFSSPAACAAAYKGCGP